MTSAHVTQDMSREQITIVYLYILSKDMAASVRDEHYLY